MSADWMLMGQLSSTAAAEAALKRRKKAWQQAEKGELTECWCLIKQLRSGWAASWEMTTAEWMLMRKLSSTAAADLSAESSVKWGSTGAEELSCEASWDLRGHWVLMPKLNGQADWVAMPKWMLMRKLSSTAAADLSAESLNVQCRAGAEELSCAASWDS